MAAEPKKYAKESLINHSLDLKSGKKEAKNTHTSQPGGGIEATLHVHVHTCEPILVPGSKSMTNTINLDSVAILYVHAQPNLHILLYMINLDVHHIHQKEEMRFTWK